MLVTRNVVKTMMIDDRIVELNVKESAIAGIEIEVIF